MSESNQIQQVKVIRNAPLTQDFQPLGYDRTHILNKVKAASFYEQGLTLNPELSSRVNATEFIRSGTVTYGINGNNFIWDSIPELENFPVSGYPNEVSQQYVLWNVQPTFYDKALGKMHINYQAIPTAYNTTVPTSKQQQIVMQVPKNQIWNSLSGTSWLQKIKTFLVGA